MDLTPLQRTKGSPDGRGRGKGDKPKDVCFYCGKPSHRKSVCRIFLHDKERKWIKSDKARTSANQPVDPATGQRLKSEAKGGDSNSLITAQVGLGQFELEEDEGGFIFALSGWDTCEENAGGSCAALQAGYNELLFDNGPAHSVCPESFELERCRIRSRTRFNCTRRTAAG